MELSVGSNVFSFRAYKPVENHTYSTVQAVDWSINPAHESWWTADLGYSPNWWRKIAESNSHNYGKYDLFRNYLDSSLGPERTFVQIGQTIPVLHDAPRNYPYEFRRDYNRYGSALGSFARGIVALNPPFAERAKQHNVQHGSTSGKVSHNGYIPLLPEYDQPSFLGSSYPRYVRQDTPNYTDSNGVPDFQSGSSGNTHRDLVRLVEAAGEAYQAGNALESDVYIDPTHHYHSKVTELEILRNDESNLTVAYNLLVILYRTGTGSYWERAIYSISYSFNWTPTRLGGGVSPVFGDITSLCPYSGGYCTRTVSKTPFLRGGSYPATHWWYDNYTYSLSYPLRMAASGKYPVNSDTTVDELVRRCQNLDNFVESKFDQVLGSATISASQAVDGFREFVNNNYLESISDLRDVLDLIPDLGPINRFLSVLPMGRVISAGLYLTDFAANTVLLTQFGLSPFANDIRIFAEKFDKIRDQLEQRLSGVHLLHGKFSYEFLDGDFTSWRLVTRSQIRCRFPKTSVVTALLPLSLSGLDPSPSQLWQVLPFSFVIDWFTKLGDKIRVGENALYMCTAEIDSCVHSYTLYRNLDEPFWEDSGFTPVDDVQYKHYHRVLSHYYPMPGNASKHYDWLGNSDGAPPLTGGSLLWTLIRR